MEYFVVAAVVFVLLCGISFAVLKAEGESEPIIYMGAGVLCVVAGGVWPLLVLLALVSFPIYCVYRVASKAIKRLY